MDFFDGNTTEPVDKERLFQRRIVESMLLRNQFPWNSGEMPAFEIPPEQSKLFADRYIEDPGLSDQEIERRALLDLNSYNFWSFFKRLHYEFRRAERYSRPLSVVMVCIDGLQSMMKDFGLHAENAILLSTGKVLLSCIRDVDIAGRCRDDTFGVILPETPTAGAQIAAERIRTHLERQTVLHELNKFTVTATVGGSSFPGSAKSVDVLIGESVQALQQGIARGGNCVHFFETQTSRLSDATEC